MASPSGCEASDEVRPVRLTVNGEPRQALAEPRLLLSDFLRRELGLTGVHVGCEQGACGACTVMVDGALARSCLMLAVQAEGADVETIEGVASPEDLDPIQAAFRECHGLQCGFCTPAMVLTVRELLRRNPKPTREEVREFLAGNLCRCTGYMGIVEATLAAADAISQARQAESSGSRQRLEPSR